jgi:hypothetical protein
VEKSKQTQDIIDHNHNEETKAPWWKRVMWLVFIYAASVLALGVVASLFRMMMTAAGMRSH